MYCSIRFEFEPGYHRDRSIWQVTEGFHYDHLKAKTFIQEQTASIHFLHARVIDHVLNRMSNRIWSVKSKSRMQIRLKAKKMILTLIIFTHPKPRLLA